VRRSQKPDIDVNIHISWSSTPADNKVNMLGMDFTLTNKGKAVAKYVLIQLKFIESDRKRYLLKGIYPGYEMDVIAHSEEILLSSMLPEVLHPNRSRSAVGFPLRFVQPAGDFCVFNPVVECELSIFAENMISKTYHIFMDNGRLFNLTGDRAGQKAMLVEGEDFSRVR